MDEKGKINNPLDLLVYIRDSFRPDNWALTAGLAWLFCGLMLALRRRLPTLKWAVPCIVSAAIIVISISAFLFQKASTYNPANAVITSKNTVVYSLPSEKSKPEEIKLKSGEEVFIEEQRLDWVRIRADKAEGWVHKNDIIRIWGDWNRLP